jgi:catechol 2,3-dioxygenase-like lactoylglutathione lyase family enzyme
MKILHTATPVVMVSAEALDETVEFYEVLLGKRARARFQNPAHSLELVLLGSMLLIGGSEAALESRRGLKAAFIVDSLADWQQELLASGASIVEGPTAGPMLGPAPLGAFMFVRHPDGSLFEYFQPR